MADADIAELRQQFSDDTAEWQDIRDEAAKDMRYVAGDPWEPEDRRARESAGRPCLSLDELSQYTNQGINKLRANKRAVKFTPTGNGANDDTAEFYSDKMREIEYRSSAQIAYITAAENAFQRSYGFIRVNTRYEHSRSVNQDIWIDPVHNPDLITPDPYALMPNMSDMKHCWVREPWIRDDFNRKYPKFKIEGSAHADLMRDAPQWVTDRVIYIAEWWKIRTTKRTLLIIQPEAPMAQQPGAVLNLQGGAPSGEPIGVFEDEQNRPPGRVLTTREVEDPSVYQCLTNGVEILDETPWPGRYIPIVSCVGKVLWVDGKRQIFSLVRLARDPAMLYNYYMTATAEHVGMSTKFPYFVRRGSLRPDQMQAIQRSLHEPIALIEVETVAEGMMGQPPEMPVRNPFEPAIQALVVGAEGARRAIQAAVGQTPLPTQAQRRNEKSGVALKQIDEAIEVGSFHFTDHYVDMIQHVGVVVEDLMDKIYDTARQVGIRKPNESAEVVWINNPEKPKAIDTKGDHIVTVSSGPSFESTRQAASDFADTLAQISPEIFAILGPMIVRLKELGPIGDEMAELLEAIQPPQVQALNAQKKQQGDPAQAAKELIATKAQLEKVMQAAGELQKQLEMDAAKQQATVEKAKIDAQTQIELQHIRNAATIRVAEIQAQVKGLEIQHEAQHETLALGVEITEAEKDREHQERVAEHQAVAAHVQAEQAHGHAVEQGERQHRHQLESGHQQVAGKLAVEASKPKPQPKGEK